MALFSCFKDMDIWDGYINGVSFCCMCLKTPSQAPLLEQDVTDFLYSAKQMTPWVCTYCSERHRAFQQLRSRVLDAQALLTNIRLGPFQLQVKHQFYVDALKQLQREHKDLSSVSLKDQSITNYATEDPEVVKNEVVLKNESLDVDMDAAEEAYFNLYDKVTTGVEDSSSHPSSFKIEEERMIKNGIIDQYSEGQRRCDYLSVVPKDTRVSNRTFAMRQHDDKEKKMAQDNHIKKDNESTAARLKDLPMTYGLKDALRRAETLCNEVASGKRHIFVSKHDNLAAAISVITDDKVLAVKLTEEDDRRRHAERLLKPEYLEMKYKCEDCAIGFQFKCKYNVHRRQHELKSQLRCHLCGVAVLKKSALTAHMTKVHFGAHRCAECSFTSMRQVTVIDHYFDQHTDMCFACVHCRKVTKKPLQMKDHMLIHKPISDNVKKPEFCDICNKTISMTPRQFKRHIEFHRWNAECPICKKRILMSSRKEHMRRRHMHRDPTVCPVCRKPLSDGTSLRAHMDRMHQTHTASRQRYECDLCGKVTFSRAEVERHIGWIHLRIGGFKCSRCNQKFLKKGILQRHVQTVHENIPLPRDKLCDVCGKGFTSTSSMKIHKRIHTGARPYACDACGQTFRQRAAMRTHIKLKHEMVKYRDLVAERSKRRSLRRNVATGQKPKNYNKKNKG